MQVRDRSERVVNCSSSGGRCCCRRRRICRCHVCVVVHVSLLIAVFGCINHHQQMFWG